MKDTHTLAMEQFAEASTWLERTGGYAHSMTLRDHFAGLGLNIIISEWEEHPDWDLEHIANSAYEIADAMLKERNK
jgi:hypothetical protein